MERENRFSWGPGDLVKVEKPNADRQRLEDAILRVLADSDLVDEERIQGILSNAFDLLDLYSYQPYDRTEHMILATVRALFLRKTGDKE